MSKLKTIIISFILLAIGLATITMSIWRFPQKMLQTENFKAEITPFNIIFYDKNGENIFKISPMDDYFYTTSTKDHIFSDSNFTQKRDIFSEFDPKSLTWSVVKDNFEITYEILEEKNEVHISRSLKNSNLKVKYIGQSITFCDECLLSNPDEGLIYITEDNLTEEKLGTIQRINLTPIVVSNDLLPVGISKLQVFNPSGEKLFELLVESNQEVFFYEAWHTLVLKTPIKEDKITQIVRF